MRKEVLALSDIVAANTLLDQGRLPGSELPEDFTAPIDVAEATRKLVENVNELPIDDEARRERVLGNAASLLEASVPLLDSDALGGS